MKKLVIAIPHSHTWFTTQTCVASLKKYPPIAEGLEVEIVLVDNSAWSPSIKGVSETALGEGVTVFSNPKSNKFHASALDAVIENFEFDYLMALETDVFALHPDWLQWFVSQLGDTAMTGAWHHEQFVNPSCTLYRGSVLREMDAWCKDLESMDMRWGENFEKTLGQPEEFRDWICGPFSDKRGFALNTKMAQSPSGKEKGAGWYEPGQMLFHWAADHGYTWLVCQYSDGWIEEGLPAHTIYGMDKQNVINRVMSFEEMESAGYTVHT